MEVITNRLALARLPDLGGLVRGLIICLLVIWGVLLYVWGVYRGLFSFICSYCFRRRSIHPWMNYDRSCLQGYLHYLV